MKLDAAANIEWTRATGDTWLLETSDEVVQTADGGYVIAGGTRSFGAGLSDALLAKFDSSGNVLWARTLGDSISEEAYALTSTADGGFALTGYTYSYGYLHGFSDVLIAKFDGAGNLQWTTTVGGTARETGSDIVQTADGGYTIAGYVDSVGSFNGFLVRLDGSGNVMWTRVLNGVGSTKFWGLAVTSDGGYVVTGRRNSVLITVFDSAGGLVSARTFGSQSGSGQGLSMIRTSDGAYALGGYMGTSWHNSMNFVLAKLDSTGASCMDSSITVYTTSPAPFVTNPVPTVTSPTPAANAWTPTITTPAFGDTTLCPAQAVSERARPQPALSAPHRARRPHAEHDGGGGRLPIPRRRALGAQAARRGFRARGARAGGLLRAIRAGADADGGRGATMRLWGAFQDSLTARVGQPIIVKCT